MHNSAYLENHRRNQKTKKQTKQTKTKSQPTLKGRQDFEYFDVPAMSVLTFCFVCFVLFCRQFSRYRFVQYQCSKCTDLNVHVFGAVSSLCTIENYSVPMASRARETIEIAAPTFGFQPRLPWSAACSKMMHSSFLATCL